MRLSNWLRGGFSQHNIYAGNVERSSRESALIALGHVMKTMQPTLHLVMKIMEQPTLSSTRAGKEFSLTITAASAAPLLLLVNQSLHQILKLYQSKDHTFSVFLHLLPSLSTNIWIKFYFFPDSPAPFQSASLWFFCSRLPPEWWCSMRLLSGD